ncbi:hypothetical protein BH23BAC4_BH23BAC4_13260 [soil metagenome]
MLALQSTDETAITSSPMSSVRAALPCLLVFALGLGCALAAFPASPQQQRPANGPAAEAFHQAAQRFISGNTSEAERIATTALRQFPNDRRLNELLELIRRQEEDAQQQEQNGEQEPDDASPQQNDDGPPQDGQDGPPSDPEDPRDGDPGDGQPQPDADRQETPQRPEPRDSRMTAEEAERLLEAVGAGEERTLRQAMRTRAPQRRVDRDW